jgi:hypothetical protein
MRKMPSLECSEIEPSYYLLGFRHQRRRNEGQLCAKLEAHAQQPPSPQNLTEKEKAALTLKKDVAKMGAVLATRCAPKETPLYQSVGAKDPKPWGHRDLGKQTCDHTINQRARKSAKFPRAKVSDNAPRVQVDSESRTRQADDWKKDYTRGGRVREMTGLAG